MPQPLYTIWDKPSSILGITFALNGYCILPSRKPGARSGLRIAFILFLVSTILFIVISSVSIPSLLTTIAIVIGSCLVLLLWILFLSIIISDPGILPRHITSLSGLVSETLLVPIRWGLDLSQIQRQNQPTAQVMIKQYGAIDASLIPVSVKFCITCRIWRPPGTHHCGTCNTCVIGFDHHCDFLGKCIGSGNMKLFILLLWTAAITSFFMEAFSVGSCITAFSGSTWTFESSIPFWIAGGTLVSLTFLSCICCSKFVQRLCLTASGLLIATGVAVGGLVVIFIAFIQSTGTETSLRGLPGLLGILIYMYTSLFTFGLALTQTGIVSARSTTKAQIEQGRKKGKTTTTTITTSKSELNESVIHSTVDIMTNVNVIQTLSVSSSSYHHHHLLLLLLLLFFFIIFFFIIFKQ
jgi:hypothetical protein